MVGREGRKGRMGWRERESGSRIGGGDGGSLWLEVLVVCEGRGRGFTGEREW